MKKISPEPLVGQLPVDSNQTKFAAEEPLFEEPSVIPVEKQPGAQLATAKKPIDKKKKMLLIGAGVLIFILLLLVILTAIKSRNKPVLEEQEIISAMEDIKEKSQLEEKLLNIEQDLERANPTLQDLPFPPIDLELKID